MSLPRIATDACGSCVSGVTHAAKFVGAFSR